MVVLLQFGRSLVVFGILASKVGVRCKDDDKQQLHVIFYVMNMEDYFTKLGKINNYFLEKVY